VIYRFAILIYRFALPARNDKSSYKITARQGDVVIDGSEPRLFGDPEVVETPDGVAYRFRGLRRPSYFLLKSSLIFLVVGAIPAAAAVAVLVFLLIFADQLPWYLVFLPCLFILQAVLVGGLFLRMAGRWFLRSIVFDVLGRHEMELRGDQLHWGRRTGPFRDGFRHSVADLRCLLVCCYTTKGGEREAHFGVEPRSRQEATFYCCGCGEQEVLALARDLHRRLQQWVDVPLEILEMSEDEAYRLAGLKDGPVPRWKRPWWLRWYVWYPWHAGGLVGLVALWAAIDSLRLDVPKWVYLLIVLGIFIELLALTGRTTSGKKQRTADA
jgi:hypothetical protein